MLADSEHRKAVEPSSGGVAVPPFLTMPPAHQQQKTTSAVCEMEHNVHQRPKPTASCSSAKKLRNSEVWLASLELTLGLSNMVRTQLGFKCAGVGNLCFRFHPQFDLFNLVH